MNIIISYNASVLTPAGFRGVTMKAQAEKISDKRARVLKVLKINDEDVTNYMSRSGAKRQAFNGVNATEREEGKIKNISSCAVL